MNAKDRKPTRQSKASRFDVQRIRVDAKGYDASGAYWGAGPDVFIVTTADGKDEVTVRAAGSAEARRKAATEIEHEADSNRQVLLEKRGGRARRRSTLFIEWQHPTTCKTVRIRITHSRDYLVEGTDHIEIESVEPKRAPFPLTETGYLSHFIDWRQLKDAGGPEQFVENWLARECRSKDWQKKDAARAQGDLFQWAEAKAETTKRQSASKARRAPPTDRPAARRKRTKPSRDHG